MTKVRTTIKMDEALYEKLRKLSFTSRRSMSDLIDEGLRLLMTTPGQRKETNENQDI